MSSYDPRIVAQALEDLEDELTRWSSTASDMLTTSEDTQRHANEAVDQALHNAAITVDKAENDKERVNTALSHADSIADKCSVAKDDSHNTLAKAQSALSVANATLQKWEAELQKALAWLARAETRLAKAIQELDSAITALRRAESDLNRAKARYRSCMNDKERRNCNGEANAVNRAQAQVIYAQQRVRTAELEVAAAKEEVRQAKARVNCCKQAVSYSSQAVAIAKESESSASQAVNFAERSLEFSFSVRQLVNVAEKNMLAEIDAAENMMVQARASQELTDAASVDLNKADVAENTAQTYSKSVRQELRHKIRQLIDLNKPAILNEGNWSLPKNVSPSEIKVYTRKKDGKTQIIYGNERDTSGQVTGEHGHTVLTESGDIDYARTQAGTVKKDTGK